MASLTRTTMMFAAAALVVLGGYAFAQTPTERDFEACNRMAQAATSGSVGSAGSGAGDTTGGAVRPRGSAGATGPIGSSSITGGADATSLPNPQANRHVNSSGRLSSSAGSPSTNSGTTSSAGAMGSPSASPRTSATDMQLAGMAATGHGDAAYQQAYRDCMKQRGF